ncbi:MAG: hypothetical protein CNIPEHKO_03050 [Anaerolineales bacterium]|nr:hypothetical protein [Anaerolineales bacterium]
MNSNTKAWQRLNDLEDILSLYYEKLKVFQRELAISSNVDAKFSITKRIEREIIPYIRQYETEYANLLASELNEIEISNEDANIVVVEIQEVVTLAKEVAQEKQAERLMNSLEKIENALAKPVSAKGKLQAAIPIIPGIISYQLELELDPYNSLVSLWQKIKEKFMKKNYD